MHSKPPSKPTAKPPKGAIALLKARPDITPCAAA